MKGYQSEPAGKVFTEQLSSVILTKAKTGLLIRKGKESFKAPQYPELDDYAFGPEWLLAGIVTGGEPTLFKSDSSNFIDLTAAIEVGSCPILYAWDGGESRWMRHGKILHKAQTQAMSGSETIAFDGFVSRFKVSEEELERFHLDAALLTIELRDGSVRDLTPSVASLAAWNGKPTDIYANSAVEIRFVLPKGIEPQHVARSRLTVNGYYDRYSTLLLSRLISKRGHFAP